MIALWICGEVSGGACVVFQQQVYLESTNVRLALRSFTTASCPQQTQLANERPKCANSPRTPTATEVRSTDLIVEAHSFFAYVVAHAVVVIGVVLLEVFLHCRFRKFPQFCCCCINCYVLGDFQPHRVKYMMICLASSIE
jgi:hypothetical protein